MQDWLPWHQPTPFLFLILVKQTNIKAYGCWKRFMHLLVFHPLCVPYLACEGKLWRRYKFDTEHRKVFSSNVFAFSLQIFHLKTCVLLVWCPWLILLVPLCLMLSANAAVQESKLSWLLVITPSQPRLLLKASESSQKVAKYFQCTNFFFSCRSEKKIFFKLLEIKSSILIYPWGIGNQSTELRKWSSYLHQHKSTIANPTSDNTKTHTLSDLGREFEQGKASLSNCLSLA